MMRRSTIAFGNAWAQYVKENAPRFAGAPRTERMASLSAEFKSLSEEQKATLTTKSESLYANAEEQRAKTKALREAERALQTAAKLCHSSLTDKNIKQLMSVIRLKKDVIVKFRRVKKGAEGMPTKKRQATAYAKFIKANANRADLVGKTVPERSAVLSAEYQKMKAEGTLPEEFKPMPKTAV